MLTREDRPRTLAVALETHVLALGRDSPDCFELQPSQLRDKPDEFTVVVQGPVALHLHDSSGTLPFRAAPFIALSTAAGRVHRLTLSPQAQSTPFEQATEGIEEVEAALRARGYAPASSPRPPSSALDRWVAEVTGSPRRLVSAWHSGDIEIQLGLERIERAAGAPANFAVKVRIENAIAQCRLCRAVRHRRVEQHGTSDLPLTLQDWPDA